MNMSNEAKVQSLKVDKEFAGLCPDLTPEEVDLLEASLTTEGCRDPIITWANHDDTILDGYNRYRICKRFNVAFKTKALTFASREEAINWIISNQLGRRNLSDQQKSYLRGRRYQVEKRADLGHGDQKSGDHSDLPKTADRLAKELNVSAPTIKRDAKFTEAVDKIETTIGPKAKQSILSGQCGLGKAGIIEAAEMPPKKMARAIKSGKLPNATGSKTEPMPEPGKVRGVGVDRANEAINHLSRIPKNDLLRKRGFQIVTDWIRHNK